MNAKLKPLYRAATARPRRPARPAPERAATLPAPAVGMLVAEVVVPGAPPVG